MNTRLINALADIDLNAAEPGGAMVAIQDLRDRGFTDAELLQLGRDAVLDLHRSDFPIGMSAAERSRCIVRGSGNEMVCFNTASLR